MISAAILVGGLSRRMGRDKAFVSVGGVPMALAVARILKRVTGSMPFLVAKSVKKYESLGLPVVRDEMPHRCALAGIHAALDHAQTSRVLITTCDQPFLSPKLLREMIHTSGTVVVCEIRRDERSGLEPFPGIYSRELLDVLSDSFADGVLSVQENLFAVGFPTILDERLVRSLDPELKTFRNLNTRETLKYVVS